MWACGVAAAAKAAATDPGLRLFVLGALGGVAGVWEARESGVWEVLNAPASRPEGPCTTAACAAKAAAIRRAAKDRFFFFFFFFFLSIQKGSNGAIGRLR